MAMRWKGGERWKGVEREKRGTAVLGWKGGRAEPKGSCGLSGVVVGGSERWVVEGFLAIRARGAGPMRPD